VQAGNYPDRPVTIIADAAPGSTPDVDTRFVAEGLGKIWGRQVAVINHPGANGSIAARDAADAAPDGYTLYMPTLSTFTALPTVAPNLPLKLPRDFLPIGFTAENPMFIAVGPSLGVTTLPQLIALAKKDPEKISIAVTGIGRLTHLTGELLQMRADIKLLTVPYTGGPAPALGDVIGGRVSMIIEGVFGDRRCGQGRIGQGDCGRIGRTPARVPRSADGGGNDPGLFRNRLAGDGGAARHACADHKQSERGPEQSGHRPGFQKEARSHRQLFARHVARGGACFCRQGAGNVAAGCAEDSWQIDRDQVDGNQDERASEQRGVAAASEIRHSHH